MTLQSGGRWFHASGIPGFRAPWSTEEGRGRRDRTFVATVVFALVVGCAGAFTAYRVLADDVEAYRATHREITVQVLSADDRSSALSRRAGTTVEVAWVDDGVRHTGMARLRADQASKAQARIWVGADDRPAAPPPGPAGMVLGSLLAGLAASGAGCSAVRLARSGRRMWIAHRAMAGWDREWRERSGV
ncbi:hypothetical protein [Streptosporangium sp. NPDC051022]|uniref:hypothetical protein n=1 Tax=Streptosporangium sp. NPDC051022 TaxID=3155752 RepID=UPI00343E2313